MNGTAGNDTSNAAGSRLSPFENGSRNFVADDHDAQEPNGDPQRYNVKTWSMNPRWRRFELDDLLSDLGVAPQSHRPAAEPALLRSAVLLDQLLDAGTPFGRADPIDHHPRMAVL